MLYFTCRVLLWATYLLCFPGRAPRLKLNSALVFPSFFLFNSSSLSQSLSVVNELSGDLSHVSTHRRRQSRQQSKTVACMFPLLSSCRITIKSNLNLHLNGCILIDSCSCAFCRAVQTGFRLREQITHIVSMNALSPPQPSGSSPAALLVPAGRFELMCKLWLILQSRAL